MEYPNCSIGIFTWKGFRRRSFTWYGVGRLFVLLVCFAVLCLPIHSQTAPQTASPQEKHMKHYALIFRATRTLTPEELKQRAVEIPAWVKRVEDMGVTLDPRNFGETAASFSVAESEVVSHEGSSNPTFVTIVFFDASSKEQAVEIARIHPGLHYGVTVEVREWTSPRETAVTR